MPAATTRRCLLTLVRSTDAHGFLHCRFASDSTSVEEIIELTEKIFKFRIISQEGPGKPEGQVPPSETFTLTRVTPKK